MASKLVPARTARTVTVLANRHSLWRSLRASSCALNTAPDGASGERRGEGRGWRWAHNACAGGGLCSLQRTGIVRGTLEISDFVDAALHVLSVSLAVGEVLKSLRTGAQRARRCGCGVQRPHAPHVRRVLSLHAHTHAHASTHAGTCQRSLAQIRAPTRRSQVPLRSSRLACPTWCSTHTHARSHGGTAVRAQEHALRRLCWSPAARPLSASSRSAPSPCSLSRWVCPLS